MADGKAAGDPDEVLRRLPRSRPHRRSAKRGDGAAAAAKPAAKRAPAKAAAKPATAKPRSRARRAAGTGRAAAGAPASAATPRRPAARRPVTTSPTASPRIAAPPRRPPGPPSRQDPVTTVVQAAGELAQVGLTIGSQLLKRAVSRLPKP
jgi:hypothetical protein